MFILDIVLDVLLSLYPTLSIDIIPDTLSISRILLLTLLIHYYNHLLKKDHVKVLDLILRYRGFPTTNKLLQ